MIVEEKDVFNLIGEAEKENLVERRLFWERCYFILCKWWENDVFLMRKSTQVKKSEKNNSINILIIVEQCITVAHEFRYNCDLRILVVVSVYATMKDYLLMVKLRDSSHFYNKRIDSWYPNRDEICLATARTINSLQQSTLFRNANKFCLLPKNIR